MTENSTRQKPDGEKRYPIKGYLILNAIFWAYCVIQILVLKWLFRDVIGLMFFFVVLAVGFSAASIYDYIFDRLTIQPTHARSATVQKETSDS